MNDVKHSAAGEWLARFDRVATALPRPRRGELREELVEHLDALAAESTSEADLAKAIARLGDPAEIVAAEGLPPVSPARSRAAKALLALPLTGLLYLLPALPPGPLTMAVIVVASVTVLVLVLRAEASVGTRALAVLGALAPPLAGLGGILDKVFQAGHPFVNVPVEPGLVQQFAWQTDSRVAVLGQLAMLVLGLGLPVLAGVRLRRPETPGDPRVFLGTLALLLTPAAGAAAALLLSGSRLGTSVGNLVAGPLVVVAAGCGVVLLAAGVLLLRTALVPLTKALVVAAVLAAPIGVVLLAQHETVPAGLVREAPGATAAGSWGAVPGVAPAGLVREAPGVTPPGLGREPLGSVPAGEGREAALAPAPAWVPDGQGARLGLGLLGVVALPLVAAARVHGLVAVGRVHGVVPAGDRDSRQKSA